MQPRQHGPARSTYLEPLMKDMRRRSNDEWQWTSASSERDPCSSTRHCDSRLLAPCTTRSSSAPACRGWRPGFGWRTTTSGSAFSSGTHDRRAELVLSPARPRLRRRPARGHQLHAQGRQDGPAGPAAAAIAVHVGRLRARAAARLGDRLSRRAAASSTTTSSCFATEVARAFPAQSDNFERLLDADRRLRRPRPRRTSGISAREVVGEIITDPLLVEMLFCPLMCYGTAREHDMDWGQFSHHVPQHLSGRARPAARPACG